MIVGLTFFCASSSAQAKEKRMNEALTINGDGAQRNPDIHWPEGQHPEDADLYAPRPVAAASLEHRPTRRYGRLIQTSYARSISPER